MEALVTTLLRLVRTEADSTVLRKSIALAEVVNSCWRSCCEKAGRRGLTFENALPVDLDCVSDPEGLRLVFSNLLDNAAEYTDQSGAIWVTGLRRGSAAEVRIANTGCQLSTEQVGQVFDTFWRADASRTETGTHFGLGLPLVRRTLLAMGGTVRVALEPGGVFVVRLVLPAG
jgi:signal transduction histidine kinase